ncbi:MAG: DUF87 domain-containing protein [Planctomycetaceae bacterium]|nr:DUF87 domain-containing protein [Planctomycetaceae bacterium]
MIPILLGKEKKTDRSIYIDPDTLKTHFHLVGATGAGKTSAIHTILRPLMLQPRTDKCCLFVIDPMGNLSRDLLRFIAHERYCTQDVRGRLVYIEPAREDVVMPFNPLTYTTEGERYYQTMRAVDIVLRAWAAQDVSQQPRLLQWLYKAFCAAAMMGLPIAMCQHLIHPGTDEHKAILQRIPGEIRTHWQEILNAKGSEPTRILESTRNRLDPFFESVNLRRMFGVTQSRFDCERFIRERKIVILNLGKYGRVPGFIADTIGALALNEIVETASRLATSEGRAVVEPTYILMDEFQKYVGVDIEDALPTVRQMGLRLILAHQSFSQLEREDVDLTQMIWQARSRLIFANNAKDADIVAEELAKVTFDPMRIKDQRTSLKQLIIGYRREWMKSQSSTDTSSVSDTRQESKGKNESSGRSASRNPTDIKVVGYTDSSGTGSQESDSRGTTSARSTGNTEGQSEANVPIHKTFREVTNVTYQSFDEFNLEWGQKIRKLKTGEAVSLLANDPQVRELAVDYFPIEDTPSLRAAVDRLLEKNFASECFVSAAEADRELEAYRRQLLSGPKIIVPHAQPTVARDDESSTDVGAFPL